MRLGLPCSFDGCDILYLELNKFISLCHAVISVAGTCTGRCEPGHVCCANAQKFAAAGGELELILYTL